jgi:hypothetical protein
VVLIACTLPLRFFKGWLVASQYVHRAAEGRLARPAPTRADPAAKPGPSGPA